MNISSSSRLYERRISELKEIERAATEKLNAISLKTKSLENFVEIKQVESEKKVLLRKKSDSILRIRNLERDLLNCTTTSARSSRNNSLSSYEPNNNSFNCDKSCDINDERNFNEPESEVIDYEDEEFDPTATPWDHERPYPLHRPSLPLPHANMRRRHGKRVGLWKENYVLGMNTTLRDNGQFTSVEDEGVDWDMMTFGEKSGRSSNTEYKYRNKCIPEEKMTVIKPKLEKLVKSRKPNIVQLVRKLSEAEEECICSRPPKLILCSGGCSYSFTGRLKMTCPSHPGDQYLMDHSPLCPKCKNALVEKSNDNAKLQEKKSPNKLEASTVVCENVVHCTPVLARKSRSKRLSSSTTEIISHP